MYKVIYKKRKTLGIYVLPNSEVEVRAPKSVSKKQIEAFIKEKENWIEKKVAEVKQKNKIKSEFELSFNSRIQFLGKEYPICPTDGKSIGFNGEYFYVPQNFNSKEIKESCIKIYKKTAKDYLEQKTRETAKIMNLNPAGIKITSAKTRWGSCNAKKNICFSWRLIMANEDAVLYVIVHELAHLVELNHSKRFWSIVQKALPDYKSCEIKLKQLQSRLSLENWS